MTDSTLADDLRAVADWVERHPEVQFYGGLQILPHGIEEFAAVASALADGAPLGAVGKRYDDTFAHLSRDFGSITVHAFEYREEVCRQVKVGTETVEVPDEDSREGKQLAEWEAKLAAARAVLPTKMVERDVTIWDCVPILPAGAQ